KYPYFIQLEALDEPSLRAYAKVSGTDYEQLINREHLAGIVVDTIPYEDVQAGKYVETKTIHTKVGQSINLHHSDWETNRETSLKSMEIAALTDQLPMGTYSAGIGGLNIITSEQVMDQLTANIEDIDVQTRLYLK